MVGSECCLVQTPVVWQKPSASPHSPLSLNCAYRTLRTLTPVITMLVHTKIVKLMENAEFDVLLCN